mmetsp:Transcript_28314/g.81367  ORF Transcript_28314/g.81367 Transcript_28314/m.81367 type:complete len:289 (+) Transcript_28314:462-1328(+)
MELLEERSAPRQRATASPPFQRVTPVCSSSTGVSPKIARRSFNRLKMISSVPHASGKRGGRTSPRWRPLPCGGKDGFSSQPAAAVACRRPLRCRWRASCDSPGMPLRPAPATMPPDGAATGRSGLDGVSAGPASCHMLCGSKLPGNSRRMPAKAALGALSTAEALLGLPVDLAGPPGALSAKLRAGDSALSSRISSAEAVLWRLLAPLAIHLRTDCRNGAKGNDASPLAPQLPLSRASSARSRPQTWSESALQHSSCGSSSSVSLCTLSSGARFLPPPEQESAASRAA